MDKFTMKDFFLQKSNFASQQKIEVFSVFKRKKN